MSGFTVPLRRRAANVLGQAVVALFAVSAVGLMLLILGLMVRRGGPVVFEGLGGGGAGDLLHRTQLVPLAANLAIAFALAAAGAFVVSRGVRALVRRRPGLRLERFAGSGAVAGFLAALLHVAILEPGLALGRGPVPWPVVGVLALSLLGRLLVAPGMGAAARRLVRPAAWTFGSLVLLAAFEASLDWGFLQSRYVSDPDTAGIEVALVGTVWISLLSLVVAVPVGIMAAVYLNEFARPGTVTTLLRASIANLAGVPSVVFGMLGLAIFVRALGYGTSVLAAGLTLGLLTVPLVIVVCEEALRSVPYAVREAAFGLGARRWQAVRHHVLPYALPGMLTGAILAFSRAMGETAPVLVVGAAAFVDFLPQDTDDPLRSSFMALPYTAYNWATEPSSQFHDLAWAAVLVLVGLVLAGNLAAILLRDRAQKRIRW